MKISLGIMVLLFACSHTYAADLSPWKDGQNPSFGSEHTGVVLGNGKNVLFGSNRIRAELFIILQVGDPTNIPTFTPTSIIIPATNTATPTMTPTVSSATATPTATATISSATTTPTATATLSSATATPTATATLSSATATPMATATPTPRQNIQPTFTPRPSNTPVGEGAPNLTIQRIFMVVDDGDENLENDVEITNPAPGQPVRFRADILNTGGRNITQHTANVSVDGVLFYERSGDDTLNPGGEFHWITEPWSMPDAGFHTVIWRFEAQGDGNDMDNSLALNFIVGDPTGQNTPTPTMTPRPGDGQFDNLFEFSGETLAENGWAEIPGGFTGAPAGIVSATAFTANLFPRSEDRRGLSLSVASGQVAFLYATAPIQVQNRPILIRASLRAQGTDAAITLAALKGSLTQQTLDGSLALNTQAQASQFQNNERQLVLVYQPDQGEEVSIVLQVAASPNQQGPVTVFVDKIDVTILQNGRDYDGSLFDYTPDDTNDGNSGGTLQR